MNYKEAYEEIYKSISIFPKSKFADALKIASEAIEKIIPRNPKVELPEHPGDYLVQFANTDRLSVFHWTGDKWISPSNSWMWDPDSVLVWWNLPEVVI